MYRLLIVTDVQDARERMEKMQCWGALGFKQPRFRQNMDEAVQCIHAHHIDAIAVEHSPAFDALRAYLDEHFPNVPLFEIAKTEGEQLLVLRELTSLLSRINADDTNDEYDEAARLQEQRERWLKKVISGRVMGQEELKRSLQMYRCRERLDRSCVLVQLEMPQEDSFFDERWHYGSDRLEVALRNFFGREQDHMRFYLAVVSPEEVRVLCCPIDQDEVSEDAARQYAQATAECVEHYLGLALKVKNVQRLTSLSAFAAL